MLLLALAVTGSSCTDRTSPVAPPEPTASAVAGVGTSSIVGLPRVIADGAHPHDVNDRGQVVGEHERQAFLWTAEGGMRYLGSLFGGSQAVAYGISNAGHVVGASGAPTAQRAFLWTEEGGMVDLGRHIHAASAANDVNVHGHAVGRSFDSFSPSNSRAFIWTPEQGIRDLGVLGSGLATIAYAINDHGTVVGTSGRRAFIWTAEGGMRDLGTPDVGGAMVVHAAAVGINNAGHVVGYVQLSGGPSTYRAFLWTPAGGMRDLGTLGGADARAFDINERGEVVGFSSIAPEGSRRAFWWSERSGMHELPLPFEGRPVGLVTNAFAISDGGHVAGTGFTAGRGTPGLLWSFGGAPPATKVLLVSRHSGLCLDVAGGSREAGAPIITWTCHGGDPQRFTLPSPDVKGEVRIYGTMCLDAGSGMPENGNTIMIWTCNGGAAQHWTLTASGDLRTANGRCADLDAWGTAPGTRVVVWDCHGGANQRWDVRQDPSAPPPPPPPPPGAVMLVNEHSGLCLDVAGDNRDPGTPLILWNCHGGAPQRWTLPVNNGPGNISVYDATGRLCLDDAGGRGENGDVIATWTCHGDAPQQWTLTPEGLLKGINGKCVDADAWGTAPGTRLILWDCHGGANQRWQVRQE